METRYFKKYSPSLGQDMEIKAWGHAGRPVLYIPCQNGRFFDFENFHMTDVWAPYIDPGRAMVFSCDTLDAETWSDVDGNPYTRIRRYEQWIDFVTGELVPFIRDRVNEANGWSGYPGVMITGCSLGATHAANLYFRRPDLFDRLLAQSGIYSTAYGFGGYMDEVVYRNSPVDYLANMPADHPFIAEYAKKSAVICCGQGAWEMPETTRRLADICAEKDINADVELWGYDVAHDWDWWYKQAAYYIPRLLA